MSVENRDPHGIKEHKHDVSGFLNLKDIIQHTEGIMSDVTSKVLEDRAGDIHVAICIIRVSGLHFPSGGLYGDIFQNWI